MTIVLDTDASPAGDRRSRASRPTEDDGEAT
jgi:hypothetical protein